MANKMVRKQNRNASWKATKEQKKTARANKVARMEKHAKLVAQQQEEARVRRATIVTPEVA